MDILDELCGSLLRADTRGAALEATASFLAQKVGPCSLRRSDEVESAPPVPPALRFDVGGAPAQSLVVVPAGEEGAAVARRAHASLARVLAMFDSEAVVTALHAAVRDREALLRQTTDAMFKDAGEVVRVLGELERRDAAMKEELHRALRFQRAMIAPLPQADALALSAVYLAADVISADFYDVSLVDWGHIRIFVADATGHGIAAGLATLFIKAEYETHTRKCATPAEVLRAMNDTLTSRYETLDVRCTTICIDIDPPSRRISYSCAAHPGPLVARAGGVELLPGGGTFVGLKRGITFPSFEAVLEPDDVMVAYTDGLIDASNAGGQSFGASQLGAVAQRARTATEPFADLVVRELAAFVGNRSLLDDVTAVGLSIRG